MSLRGSAAPNDPVAKLIRLLELERHRAGRTFSGRADGEGQRLFGGLVAAQAVVAASETLDARPRLHSLHAYFLRPGRAGADIEYAVEPTKDGRNFAARRVTASQEGDVIFTLHGSFVRAEEGIAHQDPMPRAPQPGEAQDYEAARERLRGEPRPQDFPIEIRVDDPDDPARIQAPHKQLWMRPRGRVPEDPLIHLALLVYASDRTLVSTGTRPHQIPRGRRQSASLDHAMWLHHAPRFDDWILYDVTSPAANEGRALALGAMFLPDGTRIASVAQEGLIRVR